jgi:hypothetical protein
MKAQECSICLENLNKNDLIIFQCKHIYHFSCYSSWFLFSNKNICPQCNIYQEIINIIDKKEDINKKNINTIKLDKLDKLDKHDDKPKCNEEQKCCCIIA